MENVFIDAEKQMEKYFEGHTIGSMLEQIRMFECPKSNKESCPRSPRISIRGLYVVLGLVPHAWDSDK